MTTMATERAGTRAYQQQLIDQANAEMGRQRISRRELMRRTGIPDATMNRIFNCERDMNVQQWDAIATALGFDPGELARKATGQVKTRPSPEADPRTLITWLLAHPEDDAELVTRLDEIAHQVDVRGARLASLQDTIRTVRREELTQALGVLPPHPPSTSRADQSG